MRQTGFGWGPTGVRCAQRGALTRACARGLAVLALQLACPFHVHAAAAGGAAQVQAVDTQPDPFSFTTVTNATPGIGYVGEPVTVTGITGPAPISVAGGAYKINDGPYLSQAGTVNLNDRVMFLVRSATRSNKSVTGILTIGGVSATFTVITGDFDTTPDSFPFPPVTDAERSKTYVSAPATITGITERAAIVVAGGRYRINGGDFTSAEGTVRVGDQVYAEVVASSKASTSTTATVTIGGVASAFKVTTAGTTDTVPNAFSFTPVNEAETGATYISAATASAASTLRRRSASAAAAAGSTPATSPPSPARSTPATRSMPKSPLPRCRARRQRPPSPSAAWPARSWALRRQRSTPCPTTSPSRRSTVPNRGRPMSVRRPPSPASPGPRRSVSGGRYRINDGDFTDLAGTVDAGDQVYAEVITSDMDLDGSASTAVVTIGGIAAARSPSPKRRPGSTSCRTASRSRRSTTPRAAPPQFKL